MSVQDYNRITVEVAAGDMGTLQKAAELVGVTVEQFVVQSGLTMAGLHLTDGDHFRRLHVDDAELLADLLENPPQPNEASIQAFARPSKDYDGVSDHPAKPAT
jgi:uncharacterized protein (DUF1778 family)